MREYKEKADLFVEDNRDNFLSSSEMDEIRTGYILDYMNRKPGERDAAIIEKNRSRALELIPKEVFNADYQKEIMIIYDMIVNLLASKRFAKEQFIPNAGWKKIFDTSLRKGEQVMSFFFQEPFLSKTPTVRSFLKKTPDKTVFSTDISDRISNLIQIGDLKNPDSKIVIPKTDSLQETLFFVDSRFLKDLFDMFAEEGKGIYDKEETLIGYEHPLIFHEELQKEKKGNMIPLRLLEFGKPEVITPENIGILYKGFLEVETFFQNEKNVQLN